MTHFLIKKGLKLPFKGKPRGAIHSHFAQKVALSLHSFSFLRFKCLKRLGDEVLLGEPLVVDKALGRVFFSPAHGKILSIQRGHKHRLTLIEISVEKTEKSYPIPSSLPISMETFAQYGLLPFFKQRPFGQIPDCTSPQEIVLTLPKEDFFSMDRWQEDFFHGGKVLAELIQKKIQILVPKDKEESTRSWHDFANIHTFSGKFTHSLESLLIQKQFPIKNSQQRIWTAGGDACAVVGCFFQKKQWRVERILSIHSPEYREDLCRFYQSRIGAFFPELFASLSSKQRLISGSVFTGTDVSSQPFLDFFDKSFFVLSDVFPRRWFSFLRLSTTSYTSFRTYFQKKPSFSTCLEGEERAFIDESVYHRVMPLEIPTGALIRALLAKDYALAKQLGFLCVVPEDFALATFLCPSKIEMMKIVQEAIGDFLENG